MEIYKKLGKCTESYKNKEKFIDMETNILKCSLMFGIAWIYLKITDTAQK